VQFLVVGPMHVLHNGLQAEQPGGSLFPKNPGLQGVHTPLRRYPIVKSHAKQSYLVGPEQAIQLLWQD